MCLFAFRNHIQASKAEQLSEKITRYSEIAINTGKKIYNTYVHMSANGTTQVSFKIIAASLGKNALVERVELVTPAQESMNICPE